MACGNIGKVLPSFGAFAFPFLGFDFFRPARFSAVYFPAWFVTGEVEANLTYQGVQVRSIPVSCFSISINPYITDERICLVRQYVRDSYHAACCPLLPSLNFP